MGQIEVQQPDFRPVSENAADVKLNAVAGFGPWKQISEDMALGEKEVEFKVSPSTVCSLSGLTLRG